jgi:hypothetical protein
MKLLRPMLNIALFLTIFVAPFWVPIALLILGLIMIPYYFESIIVLFCLELLYHGAMPLHEMLFLYAPAAVALLFFAFQGLRRVARERIFRF